VQLANDFNVTAADIGLDNTGASDGYGTPLRYL
jgi:hypothetical protein